MRHERGDRDAARALCEAAHESALKASNSVLAGEALNTLGAMYIREGMLAEAEASFTRALAFGGASHDLRARVEQNLGVVANIRGDREGALERYRRCLEAYERLHDRHGESLAYHNMGMVSAQLGQLDEADIYFLKGLTIMEEADDLRSKAVCMINRAEQVLVPRQHFDEARRITEAALAICDQLGDMDSKGSAYRVIGVVFRETGRHVLAESRLRSSIELSVAAGSVLHEAESARELAVLYQLMGRNQDALTLLNTAYRLFRRVEAQRDLINVAGKVDALETTYFAVVRDWGQSIESSDSYTFGHCERVADRAVAVAVDLGLDNHQQKLIRLGAYLHDVGKVKVPHEVLNKPGPLTREEFEIMQMHPVWGIELLAGVEFPWELKPIIRWHHEKYDGTGYPDRLQGDEIPLSAQIVGIVDVYDALTTTRAYRKALSHETAIAEITRCRGHWSDRVYEGFMRVVGTAPTTGVPRGESATSGDGAAGSLPLPREPSDR